jgi:hypothetical protein
LKNTAKTNKQTLARPYAVLVAGDAAEQAFLTGHDDLASAERRRKEWLAATARRGDRPAAATYVRIGDQEADVLNAIKELASLLTDRNATVKIRCAVEDIQDRRNGKTF